MPGHDSGNPTRTKPGRTTTTPKSDNVSGETPTEHPGQTPTAHPGMLPGGTPTAQPGIVPGFTPTAKPGQVSGEIPTAQPVLSGGTPTPKPGQVSGAAPTAQPGTVPGEMPTAHPGMISGGTPTPKPEQLSGESPTAHPGMLSGGTPTAQPGQVPGVSPSAQPGMLSIGTPTAQPGHIYGETPSAQPGMVSSGTPTAKPGQVPGEIPTAQPGPLSGGTPTAHPEQLSGGTPTAQPGSISGEIPTAHPGMLSGGTPTAQPGQVSGQMPTAQPEILAGGTPTAHPGQLSGATPTIQPGHISGEIPTAQPGMLSGGTPTAQPGQVPGASPSAQPGPLSGGTPTAHPEQLSGGTPTAQPGHISGEIPTAHPGMLSGGTPTAQPEVSGRTGTAAPTPACEMLRKWSNWVNKNTPTSPMDSEKEAMTPIEIKSFCSGKIIAVECQSVNGIPSYSTGDQMTCDVSQGAFCNGMDNYPVGCQDYMVRYQCEEEVCSSPTPAPVQGQTGVPTPAPGQLSNATPTAHPLIGGTGTPTAVPTACSTIMKWSNWLNNDSPDSGDGDYESMNAKDLSMFCGSGKIASVECKTTNNIPYYSTGDVMYCDMASGVQCNTADNFPVGCQDYMIRYQCEETICQGTTKPTLSSTVSPVAGQTANPTQGPNPQQGETPTKGPLPGSFGGSTPTAKVPAGSNNIPTAQPTPGETESPTAAPLICVSKRRWSMWVNRNSPAPPPAVDGDKESMTAEELHRLCGSGKITAVECETVNGISSENSGDMMECSIQNGVICDGMTNFPIGCQDYKIRYQCEEQVCTTPTAQPGMLSGGTPTPKPGMLSGQTPTAQPEIISGGTPTAQPGHVSGEIPTAHPGLVSGGTPTAQPGIVSGEIPTAHPGMLSGGTPTAQPGHVSGEIPTAHPGLLSGGTPTAQPGLVSGEIPTAQPGMLSGGTPTAQPGHVSGEIPTAHPGLLSGGTPTAKPEQISGETPTAQPGPLSGQTPTAQPGPLSGQTPTAQPGMLPGDTPTAQPGQLPEKTPTPQPGMLSGKTPTAQPGMLPGGTPTAQPEQLQGSTPTPKPGQESGETPTAHPQPGQSVPTAAPVATCTQSLWSSWINRDNPSLGDGDYESFTAKELSYFCPNGKVTRIECVTDTGIEHYSSGEQVSCTVQAGLKCSNDDNAPMTCSDYRVRYFCECSPTPTPGQTTTAQPKPVEPLNPTIHIQCAWSPWLNSDKPKTDLTDAGDLETIQSLKTKYGLCKSISDIKCRVANSNTPSSASGQSGVTCDIVNGLRCYNKEQVGQICYDYEVSLLCWSPECTTTPTPGPTPYPGATPPLATMITAVCPPGETWNSCAYNCDEMCDGFAQRTGMCEGDNKCVPTCKPEGVSACSPGLLLKDKRTCVKESMCPCLKQDGTVAQPYETWTNPMDQCSHCLCANNTIQCTKDDSCVPTPTTTLAPEMLSRKTPTPAPYISPIVHPDCQWTAWINTDRPDTGNGDLETISKIRTLHMFCESPLLIECRDAKTKNDVKASKQTVTCDLTSGLKCLNWDNGGQCDDYEVRFFCPCASSTIAPAHVSGQTPTPVPGQISGQSPTPAPSQLSGGTPTPAPGLISGHSPTAAPGQQGGSTPTPAPGPISGHSPTAAPSQLNGATPTPAPGVISGQAPTAAPGQQGGSTPTPAPGPISGHSPTAAPSQQSGETPTPAPGLISGQAPTAAPGQQGGSTPTPAPGPISGHSPTAAPSQLNGATPTPAPGVISGQAPTAAPGQQGGSTPTPAPGPISGHSPTAAPSQLNGVTPTPAPGLISGQAPTAAPGQQGGSTPTPAPGPISGHSPTAAPSQLNGATPTPAPGVISGQAPTAATGQQGGSTPTPAPGPISDHSPTAAPSQLNGVTPTPAPGVISGHSPTAAPGQQGGSTPTPAPGPISGHSPTAAPSQQSGETPTSAPGLISGHSPTAAPGQQGGSTPTPAPGPISGQSPTAAPSQLNGATPTPAPGLISGQTPTAAPGQQGGSEPSPAPGQISDHSPTAAPHQLSGATPTLTPSQVSGHSPTAAPGQHGGSTPTLAPGQVSGQTPVPRLTICGWTPWLNGHKPDEVSGESEIFTDLHTIHSFCNDMDIQSIECREADTYKPFSETGQKNVVCDIASGGLMCFNFDQPSGKCLDYEIRVFCEPKGVDCTSRAPGQVTTNSPTPAPYANALTPTKAPSFLSGATPTMSPSYTGNGEIPSTMTKVPVPITTCADHWSEWINKDSPETGDGDKEASALEYHNLTGFCAMGKITSIECQTKEGISSESYGDVMQCTLDTGADCSNDVNFPMMCQDYKIRYFCAANCASPAPNQQQSPTPAPETGVTALPTKSPYNDGGITPSRVPGQVSTDIPTAVPQSCTSGWSSWINHDNPTSDDKEIENMTPEELQKFCPNGKITRIDCETASGIPHYSSGEILSCTIANGLTCNNGDNFPISCSDYKVKYYCECEATPTAAPSATGMAPTAAPSATGVVPTAAPSVTGVAPTAQPTPGTSIPDVCAEIMGMKDGRIRDDMITVSSSRNGAIHPTGARLDSNSAWIAGVNDRNQYIQVNFLAPRLLTGVTTQGRAGIPSYVKTYIVSYSYDGFNWNNYQEVSGIDKVYIGNSDSDSHVTHWFIRPIRAQFLRIIPQSWQGVIAMRLEIHGCYEMYPTTAAPPVITGQTPTATPAIIGQGTPSVTQAPQLLDSCIEWDRWVNEGHLTLTSGGDFELISLVQNMSTRCHTPMKIQCVRASDELPADQTGQVTKCNLWDGFSCSNADQIGGICYEYKVRLGCLKNTPECVPQPTPTKTAQHATTVITGKSVLPCVDGMDTSACPASCPEGQYCDGVKCVHRSECTCLIDGKVIRPGFFTENKDCATCTCVGGDLRCEPKKCPACPDGYTQSLNTTTCQCNCKTCATNEFRCGNGQCIPSSLLCDGVIDCMDDEKECGSVKFLTPPSPYRETPTRGPMMNFGETPTLPTTMQHHDMNTPTTRRPKEITSLAPAICVASKWSDWINRDTPNSGDGDVEVMSTKEKNAFCPGGKIASIECVTTDEIPLYSSGETATCDIQTGFLCSNNDNAPMPCSDYKVRYYCDCSAASPTPGPMQMTTAIPTAMPEALTTSDICKHRTCSVPMMPTLKPGEIARIVTVGCCNDYEVFCKPELCSSPALRCNTPMALQKVNSEECCPTYKCICPPTCPPMVKPQCAQGSEVVEIQVDCNCTQNACVYSPTPAPTLAPNPVCKYTATKTVVNGTEVPSTNSLEITYNVGDTWSDGLCKYCQCNQGSDGHSEISCHTNTCPACKVGERRVPHVGKCCGDCQAIGCVVNGKVYRNGEEIVSSRNCYNKRCVYDVILKNFLISETQVECGRIDALPPCQGNETSYDATGCCMKCVPASLLPAHSNASSTCSECTPRLVFGQPQRSVGYFRVSDNGELCQNLDVIADLKECSGYCGSQSSYTSLMQGFNSMCQCCRPTTTITKTIKLACASGRTISKTYSVPQSCGCGVCT
ncbi:hypothetical protein CHS0354_039096 [Potamilus streckersoni]|uniref:Uncharacterized protein n=1 Tax=Potamilus streckersoni TaxID=2493646 RepID=A0AAE0TJG0_9BIVA|nr:hypothetical protein CHS0354_039096 [Potamilus streckersoni]